MSFQVLGQNGVVMLGNVFDNFVAMLFVKFRSQSRRLDGFLEFWPRLYVLRIPELFERQNFVFRTEGFVLPDDGAFFDEIDHTDKVVFSADRKLQRNGVG